MKRHLAFVLILAALFSLASCEKSPKACVEDLFLAVKDRDPDKETALLALSEEEEERYFYGLTGDAYDAYFELNRLSSLFPAYLAALAEEASFSVESVTENGSNAAVTVRANYADCTGFFVSLIPEIRQEIFTESLNGGATLEKAFDAVLTRHLTDLPEATEHRLTLELKKIDGAWKILPSPAVTTLCTFDLYTDGEAILAALDNAGDRAVLDSAEKRAQ